MTTCRLAFFIDALGAEVVAGHAGLADLGAVRRLRSVFGYSSACVPSILTGRTPAEHGHWSYFTYRGPGTGLRVPLWLRALPAPLRDRGRVRRWLSRGVAAANRITGYFQLYQMPIESLSEYGHCEPRDIFAPGGMGETPTILDRARATGLGAWCSDWHRPTAANWQGMEEAVADPATAFALIYDADLDGWLHQHSREDAGLQARLDALAARMRTVIAAARRTHAQVEWSVFSDHGMCSIRRSLDVLAPLAGMDQRMHRDWRCVVDSTMVRAWYPDAPTRSAVRDRLDGITGLRRLAPAELVAEGCGFADDRFGQDIWLAEPGVLLVPSHMGRCAMAGMHGYAVAHPDSDAVFISSDGRADPHSILDIHDHLADGLAAAVREAA